MVEVYRTHASKNACSKVALAQWRSRKNVIFGYKLKIHVRTYVHHMTDLTVGHIYTIYAYIYSTCVHVLKVTKVRC